MMAWKSLALIEVILLYCAVDVALVTLLLALMNIAIVLWPLSLTRRFQPQKGHWLDAFGPSHHSLKPLDGKVWGWRGAFDWKVDILASALVLLLGRSARPSMAQGRLSDSTTWSSLVYYIRQKHLLRKYSIWKSQEGGCFWDTGTTMLKNTNIGCLCQVSS